jgi:signal peptidase I
MNATCDQNRNVQVASHKGRLIFASGLIALLLMLRTHFSLYIAKGESMLPGLRSGDLVLVDRLAYQATEPKRGEVVVARDRDDLIVKRVVGLPGEEVELLRGKLQINRLPLAEAYAVEPGWLSLQRGRLLEDRYAILGDNRSVSSSVFVHAVVSKDQIVGKVIYSLHLWPGRLRSGFNPAT